MHPGHNVGADHLDAAFALARNNARFAICGMIANYNDATPASFRFIARIIAEGMRASLGQVLIIENVSGGAGTIGVARVARAKADGHTIVFGTFGHSSRPAI